MKKGLQVYDLAVIGSGEAGIEAASTAAKNGLRVVIIEASKWGGSNLNYTNVPLGALFHGTQLYKQAVNGAKFGLSSANLRYNYPTLNNWKNTVIRHATANVKKDLEELGITCIQGSAHLLSSREISVNEETINAKKILIATGASILDTGIKIPDDVDYWLPDSTLDVLRPPKSIFIVGAGSTGCELAQYYATLGTEVVIADIAGRLLPSEDEEVGQVLEEIFEKAKIKILTQSRVIALENAGDQKRVIFLRGGQEKSVRVDAVMLCTGSAANTDIGLENAGVKYNRHGIEVDKTMRTSAKNIYAAGDVVGGHSSTEKAILEARVATEHIIKRSKAEIDLSGVIRITNCYPEIAEVGLNEDDCLRADRRFSKAIVALEEVQKSNICDFRDGFVKIICSKSGRILGGTIVAPNAGLLAQELAMALRFGLSVSDLANTPHLINDWSESLRLACAKLVK